MQWELLSDFKQNNDLIRCVFRKILLAIEWRKVFGVGGRGSLEMGKGGREE